MLISYLVFRRGTTCI